MNLKPYHISRSVKAIAMPASDISIMRLHHQHIGERKLKSPVQLVAWMGAMQAQDLNMARWAIGVRLPGTTQQNIKEVFDRGGIIRTHVLRPTWHFVSAADVDWMLDLTAPHIKASLQPRHRQLELSPQIINKSNRIFEKALDAGRHLTREELVDQLERGKIRTHDQRAAHLLLCAELDKIICSGPMREKKITYSLFSERIPPRQKLQRDEALAALIQRYFQSHGPATMHDFAWWSGLPVKEAMRAIESGEHGFRTEKIGTQRYWYREPSAGWNKKKDSIYLLPAFDEFIISYKDRSACLPENQDRAISSNGIFWPAVVVNGTVMGRWKRAEVKKKMAVQTEWFQKSVALRNKEARKHLQEAVTKVETFFADGKIADGE